MNRVFSMQRMAPKWQNNDYSCYRFLCPREVRKSDCNSSENNAFPPANQIQMILVAMAKK